MFLNNETLDVVWDLNSNSDKISVKNMDDNKLPPF